MTHVTAFAALAIIGAVIHFRAQTFNASAIGLCTVYAGVIGLVTSGVGWLLR